MAEKPILFNTEMVKAILKGKKTQTRRVIKPQPEFAQFYEYKDKLLYEGENRTWCYKNHVSPDSWNEIDWINQFAPYQPGDTLYVRETWAIEVKGIGFNAYEEYIYRTNPPLMCKWNPASTMPKEAARIWLKVTNVRVERLQDITKKDYLAEGMPSYRYGSSAKGYFKPLWDKMYERKGYGWDANPWVWVYEFERVEK